MGNDHELTEHYRARKETRLNGTLTLRRSSANPNAAPQSSSQQDLTTSANADSATNHNPVVDIPADARYTKDKLLDIYMATSASVSSNDDVSRLFVNNWNPEQSSTSGGRGWGKANDTRDNTHGPEVCWDQSGELRPIGLEEMTESEKAVRILIILMRELRLTGYRFSPATSTLR
jgi:PERQ amino acid-rich with GYF domain-containing protein